MNQSVRNWLLGKGRNKCAVIVHSNIAISVINHADNSFDLKRNKLSRVQFVEFYYSFFSASRKYRKKLCSEILAFDKFRNFSLINMNLKQ